jgi:hypothetical protein
MVVSPPRLRLIRAMAKKNESFIFPPKNLADEECTRFIELVRGKIGASGSGIAP